ncbi:MAG TPA: 4-hydroxy-3-methylbut-2-enyl diphosphate reductase [Candidatus Omnitrophota bacterium]|nr:4-hydroxy-3-methylbut-2-enyl diphosphate reductase [Candidatus Omnitrophota bacterium]
MKITIAKNAGFCFGVKRAIDIALESAKQEKPVYMLGDIVHNENVVKTIEDAGIKKTKTIPKENKSNLLIRAHGSAQKTLDTARKSRLNVIDATCPMVKEIHKIVIDMDKKGYKILVIGDHKHDEVQGIIGQIKHKAVVLENAEDIKAKITRKLPKAAVVVQSTQNLEKALKMQNILKDRVEDLKFFNTICAPTRMKQEEIKSLAQANDRVIVIGSKTSANTKRLYEIAKSINPRSYWVNSTADIQSEWLKKAKSIGITAGASTPDETIEEIKDYIQENRLRR